MANNELPDICIADFVENMLTEQTARVIEGKESAPDLTRDTSNPPMSNGAEVPDISNVEVPDTLMEMWTGKKAINYEAPLETKKEPIVETTQVEKTSTVSEIPMDKFSSVVKGLQKAVTEAQNLLIEMTTVGMIGTNLSGPTSDPMKQHSYGYSKNKKSKKKKKKKRMVTSENAIIADALKEYLKN
jgi:hypothetical protein|tara:strand:- start:437 stop:994 length:558 start_codon:yes stop_codon:yes gene_type:complete